MSLKTWLGRSVVSSWYNTGFGWTRLLLPLAWVIFLDCPAQKNNVTSQ